MTYMEGMGNIGGVSGTRGNSGTQNRRIAATRLTETVVTKMRDGSKKVKKIMRDINGETLATLSYTIAAPRNYIKLKKLQYNFKQISAMIMNTKTSSAASQVVSKARQKVITLQRQKNSGQYDSEALDNAIKHAKSIERAAKKKMKHLRQEEAAGNNSTVCVSELDEILKNEEETLKTVPEETIPEEEMLENSEEELERLMQELADAMREAEEEMPEEFSLNDIFEIPDPDMSPEDLERLKKKHRFDEMREIMEADMKYLKAVFEKLAREQQANTAKSVSSNNGSQGTAMSVSSGTDTASSSAALETAGTDMPAQTADVSAAAVGGSQIDVLL